jgi:hypothetical protein
MTATARIRRVLRPRRRAGVALALWVTVLSGCVDDPVRQLVVRNDTDRSLAFQALAPAELATLGAPVPLLDPASPGFAGSGFMVLAPGAETALDAPSPGDGVALVIYVDRLVADGTYAFSDTPAWTEKELRDSDGRVRIVSYRQVG